MVHQSERSNSHLKPKFPRIQLLMARRRAAERQPRYRDPADDDDLEGFVTGSRPIV